MAAGRDPLLSLLPENREARMNFSELKLLAKERHVPVTDLIALAPGNDPFYCGTPGQTAQAEWFARLWQEHGFPHGAHLRRVHYVLISQRTPVLMPNGTPYENTEGCWAFIGTASKAARYLGLVDMEAFDDRRNPPAVVYSSNEKAAGVISLTDSFPDASLPDFPDLPDLRFSRPVVPQPYLTEVWCEKSTMNDELKPVCERNGANLVTGLGELSVTAVVKLRQRAWSDGRPVRVFYISDFDPAGQSMPVAVSRKIEFLLPGQDVRLYHIALTQEQCRKYKLPRTPIKESEKRAARFEARFGEGATELDALEALHPGELAKMVRKTLRRYQDRTLEDRIHEHGREIDDRLDTLRGNVLADVLARHGSDLTVLRARYAEIKAGLESWTAAAGVVWHAMSEELRTQAEWFDRQPDPEPGTVEELPDPLFDSSRGYETQIAAYKEFQGKAA